MKLSALSLLLYYPVKHLPEKELQNDFSDETIIGLGVFMGWP